MVYDKTRVIATFSIRSCHKLMNLFPLEYEMAGRDLALACNVMTKIQVLNAQQQLLNLNDRGTAARYNSCCPRQSTKIWTGPMIRDEQIDSSTSKKSRLWMPKVVK